HTRCWERRNGCDRADCSAQSETNTPCWQLDDASIKSRVFEPRFPPQLDQCRSCEIYLQSFNEHPIRRMVVDLDMIRNVLKNSWDWIRRSRSLRMNLIRNSFDAIIACNKDDVITLFNREAQKLFGYEESEVLGLKKWHEVLPVSLSGDMCRPVNREQSEGLNGFFRKELTAFHKNSAEIPIRASGIVLKEQDDEQGKVFFIQDMREINHLREGLIRSERLAATGQTVAGISHSIRNILDGLRGGIYIYNRGKNKGDTQQVDRGWQMVERNIAYISELVNDLLNFSKDRELRMEPCDPQDLLAHVMETVNRKASEKEIRVTHEISAIDNEIMVDPHAMHQCLTNLLSNAIDAIPHGRNGEVSLTLNNHEDHLRISVTDNGIGMKPEVRRKVLQGMFSTKGSKGTGLGVLVAQKIALEHGGDLLVESTEGRGSTFTVRIPSIRPERKPSSIRI
ncbi:MAG: ATP-binding protein, partial [Planctomycetota bacterium]